MLECLGSNEDYSWLPLSFEVVHNSTSQLACKGHPSIFTYDRSRYCMHRHGCYCMQCAPFWACANGTKMASYNEPSNQMHRESIFRPFEAKTIITQTCALKNGVDLYTIQAERLGLCLVRWSSILCLKEDDKMACFDTTWLALIQKFSKTFLESLESKSGKNQNICSLKFRFDWAFELFVLYCTYGSVQLIPT